MISIARIISYGSSGNDVRELQKKLNSNGYSLDVDGIFGSNTQAAVRDYQKKNGLSVDGIVGSKTWSSLNSGGSYSQSSSQKNQNFSGEINTPRPVYEKSQGVIDAENSLKQWEQNKPDSYQSEYSDKIDEILQSILNRESFDYNMSSDPLYEQYKEQYMSNGKKAMMDTVGNASSLTGGYSNSYAVTAGNQAYQEYLTRLDDIALDLRDRAYQEYKDEGDRLIESVTLLRNLDGDAYDKYLGELERYYKDGDYLLERLSQMSDSEFEAFVQEVENWESDRDYAFKQYQDALDREEFEREMAFKQAEAERDQRNADRNYALAARRGSSSSSSGSNSSNKEDSGKTVFYPTTYNEFCMRTGVTTIMTSDEFYMSSKYIEAYDTYEDYLKEMYDKYK